MKSVLITLAVLIALSGLAYANQKPAIVMDDSYSTKEGMKITLILNGHDPDGDPFVYSATRMPRGAVFDGRTFTWTPDFDQQGNYNIRFTATDNHGASSSKTIKIIVLDENHAPVINSLYPYEGRTVEFQESSSRRFTVEAVDPDDDTLRYAWSIDGKTKGRSSSFLYESDYEDAGQHTLALTVSDGKIEKKVFWNIIIRDYNRAPRFTKNKINIEGEEGKLVKFTANAKDDDKDMIIFTSSNLPRGAGLDSGNGEFTWIPDINQRGYYEVVVRARDDKGGNDWITFFLHITNSSRLEELDRAQRSTDTTITPRGVISGSGVVPGSGVVTQNTRSTDTVIVASSYYGTSDYFYDYNDRNVGNVVETQSNSGAQSGLAVVSVLSFLPFAALLFI